MKPVNEMDIGEVSNAIIQLGKLKKLDTSLRERYVDLVEEGEEEHELIEICPGRQTKSWVNVEEVIPALLFYAEELDIPVEELLQPVAPGKLMAAFKKRKVSPNEDITGNLEIKTGNQFTRIKPQTDPETFRD